MQPAIRRHGPGVDRLVALCRFQVERSLIRSRQPDGPGLIARVAKISEAAARFAVGCKRRRLASDDEKKCRPRSCSKQCYGNHRQPFANGAPRLSALQHRGYSVIKNRNSRAFLLAALSATQSFTAKDFKQTLVTQVVPADKAAPAASGQRNGGSVEHHRYAKAMLIRLHSSYWPALARPDKRNQRPHAQPAKILLGPFSETASSTRPRRRH